MLAIPLALALGLAAAGRSAPAESTWAQHLAAGRAAFAAGDEGGARRHLLLVDSLVGGHSGAKSALATLAARAGDREGALRWLDALARTGIARPVAADSAFARWFADSAFRAVAARLAANALPLARAEVARDLGDPGLLAEDVAWDAKGRRFLVSSIHRRRIVAIDEAGRVTGFAAAGDGAWGVYGLACDAARGRLWATTAAGPECEGWSAADSGRTALLAFDLRSGRRLSRIELARTGARRVLGDVAVGPDGTVYASESLGGSVHRLFPGADTLETLVPPGTFRSPQMPVPLPGGRTLVVADYARGIAAIDLATRAVRWPAKPYDLASGGIDGLYRTGRRWFAVQNGTTPHRVIELEMDPGAHRITSWRVLEQASERLGEPNHGAVVEGAFWFIGDSGWDRVGDDGALATPADARPPVLLRLPLAAGPRVDARPHARR